MGCCGCRRRPQNVEVDAEPGSATADATALELNEDESTALQAPLHCIPSVQPYRPGTTSFDDEILQDLIEDEAETEAVREHCRGELQIRARKRQRERELARRDDSP